MLYWVPLHGRNYKSLDKLSSRELPKFSYIYWVLALWLLDRLARLFCILYRNMFCRGTTKVTIETLPSDTGLEACRVSFKLARPWKYTPGCHAYVYLPSLSFWMSHPFSIAWLFADDVRRAVRDVVEGGTVDFVEEAFTW